MWSQLLRSRYHATSAKCYSTGALGHKASAGSSTSVTITARENRVQSSADTCGSLQDTICQEGDPYRPPFTSLLVFVHVSCFSRDVLGVSSHAAGHKRRYQYDIKLVRLSGRCVNSVRRRAEAECMGYTNEGHGNHARRQLRTLSIVCGGESSTAILAENLRRKYGL